MEIEFAEIVQDSPDEPLHLNIWVGGVCRSFLVEDVLAKMDAVEQPLAPDGAKWCENCVLPPDDDGNCIRCGEPTRPAGKA